jgi:predicted acetyltransferase
MQNRHPCDIIGLAIAWHLSGICLRTAWDHHTTKKKDMRTSPLHIRRPAPDETDAFVRAAAVAFGEHISPEEAVLAREELEIERALASFEAGDIVATIAAISMELTVPGNLLVPAGGISWAGVLPTHRRRGLLRELLAATLDDVVAHGEPLAMLTASESHIYGRFGFGPATASIGFEIDRVHAGFLQPPRAGGRIRLLDVDTASAVLPVIYDNWRVFQPGAVSRSPGWWKVHLADQERYRDGAGPRFIAVHDGASGTPDGYVTYRIKTDWQHGLPANTLVVEECVARDPGAHGLLWHFCLNTDLVATVSTWTSPVDEPLRWRLADPRRMRGTRLVDGLWVRLLDVPAALAARRYQVVDSLIVEVADRARPEVAGTYELSGGPKGSTCHRTKRSPDLAMDVAYLGAAYLGGMPLGVMARAGAIREVTPGAAARADLMFAVQPAPWSHTDF